MAQNAHPLLSPRRALRSGQRGRLRCSQLASLATERSEELSSPFPSGSSPFCSVGAHSNDLLSGRVAVTGSRSVLVTRCFSSSLRGWVGTRDRPALGERSHSARAQPSLVLLQVCTRTENPVVNSTAGWAQHWAQAAADAGRPVRSSAGHSTRTWKRPVPAQGMGVRGPCAEGHGAPLSLFPFRRGQLEPARRGGHRRAGAARATLLDVAGPAALEQWPLRAPSQVPWCRRLLCFCHLPATPAWAPSSAARGACPRGASLPTALPAPPPGSKPGPPRTPSPPSLWPPPLQLARLVLPRPLPRLGLCQEHPPR